MDPEGMFPPLVDEIVKTLIADVLRHKPTIPITIDVTSLNLEMAVLFVVVLA